MPANIIKSFSDKSGKSEQEVERLWDKAKKIVKDEYPEVGTDSDRYYSLVTGILKSMLKLENNFSSFYYTTKFND